MEGKTIGQADVFICQQKDAIFNHSLVVASVAAQFSHLSCLLVFVVAFVSVLIVIFKAITTLLVTTIISSAIETTYIITSKTVL